MYIPRFISTSRFIDFEGFAAETQSGNNLYKTC